MHKHKFVRTLSIINMSRTTITSAEKGVTRRILTLLLLSGLNSQAQAADSLLGWLNGEGQPRATKQQGRPSLPKDVVLVPVEKLQPSRKVNGEPHAVDPERLARLQQLDPRDRPPIKFEIHAHELHILDGHHRVAAAKVEGMDFVRGKPVHPLNGKHHIPLSDALPVLGNQAGPAVNPALKKERWRPKFGRK